MHFAYDLGSKEAALSLGLGAGLGAMAGLGAVLAGSKPARAELGHLAEVTYLGRDPRKVNGPPPSEAQATAKQIADYLRSKAPDARRIGIVGVGGSGKSTLAKGLSKELGLRHLDLDWTPHRLLGDKIPKGSVAEQYELLHHANPEQFDALIHTRAPMDEIEKRLLARRRGAIQLELADYPKLDKAITGAFDSAKGETFSPNEGVRVKTRPEDGYGMQVPKEESFLRKDQLAKGLGLVGGGAAAGALLAHLLK